MQIRATRRTRESRDRRGLFRDRRDGDPRPKNGDRGDGFVDVAAVRAKFLAFNVDPRTVDSVSLADVKNMFVAYAAAQKGGRMVSDDEFEQVMAECREMGVA